MQVTIQIPDGLPQELIEKRIKEIEERLKRDAESIEGKEKISDISMDNNDPWANPEIDLPAIDTGREDGSINHTTISMVFPRDDELYFC